MTYKTILVHCDSTPTVNQRLEVAAELTERFGANLVGLHSRPPFDTPAYFDIGVSMAPVFEAYQKGTDADEAIAEAAFKGAIKGKHLASEWRVLNGYPERELAVNGRYADLVVVGQADETNVSATPDNLPESMAFATGRPVLVVPKAGAVRAPGKIVMLCWNASRESARAAMDALPFLKAAERVIVMIVDPHASNGHGAEPGADVALWLARHGIKVLVQREFAGDAEVGDVLLSRVGEHGVDLIVMGAYGHSRLREMVLGGVSRTLLQEMTVPVLMSH